MNLFVILVIVLGKETAIIYISRFQLNCILILLLIFLFLFFVHVSGLILFCVSSFVSDSAVLEEGIRARLPSRQMWEYLLTHFLGAAALLSNIASRCTAVFLYPMNWNNFLLLVLLF